ncbi:11671_t:CDS:2, partial [Dentiscutata heterogama]
MLSSESDTLNSTSDTDTLSSTSDSLSSCDQLTIIEKIELQSEVRTESTQTIVDSGIDFQALPGEYGPYFKNFTEISFFTWVTKHMIIPIQNMKTLSISTPFKNSYTISISEYIRRILGNKSLQSQMYFGPGIEAETKS